VEYEGTAGKVKVDVSGTKASSEFSVPDPSPRKSFISCVRLPTESGKRNPVIIASKRHILRTAIIEAMPFSETSEIFMNALLNGIAGRISFLSVKTSLQVSFASFF
jgi:hypothetical protein